MKNLNIHNLKKEELFFNHRAAQIFFLTHDWKSIREVSRNYNAIHLLILEKENPKKFLLELVKSKNRGGYLHPNERAILKNILHYTEEAHNLKIFSSSWLEKISKRKVKKIINSLYKLDIEKYSRNRKHKPKTYTNPMVQKYCTIFKKLGWVKERRVTKSFQRISKKGKVHIYSKPDWRMKMNLSQVVVDYITVVRKVYLNKKEEDILKLIFSVPTFSDFLIRESTIFDKDIFPLLKDNIATFVEKVLFRFLYIATSIKAILGEDEIKIIKKIIEMYNREREGEVEALALKIDEKIKDLSASSFCPVLFKIMALFSPKLLEKVVRQALETHLSEVIQTNLSANRNNLLL
jgi:hypothetical protein